MTLNCWVFRDLLVPGDVAAKALVAWLHLAGGKQIWGGWTLGCCIDQLLVLEM